MTTLLDAGTSKPGTHALILGVGKYCYLKGGDKDWKNKKYNLGLGQLTSPPLSARAITDWLFNEHRNPEAPLSSVELLLSPAGTYRIPGGSELEVDSATMASVAAAYQLWYQRCNRHKDNVAIFFFCGHGVQKSGLFLLLEDFCQNPDKMFGNAIHFEGAHRGLASKCVAKTQCFLADSCRQVPFEILALTNPRGESFLDEVENVFYPEDWPRFYATAPNDSAYGLGNEPTAYTKAVLAALRGAASRKGPGGWVVTTGYLQEGIRASLEWISQRMRLPVQRPLTGGESSGTSTLSVLANRPVVPVKVTLRPPDAWYHASLSLVSINDPQRRAERPPRKGNWELELPADEYDGHAVFESGPRSDPRWRVSPVPPRTDTDWEM